MAGGWPAPEMKNNLVGAFMVAMAAYQVA